MTKGETIGNGRTKSSDKEMPQLWPLWASKESYEWDSMSRKDQMSDIAALNHLKAGKGRNRMDEGWAMAHPHKNALDWAQMTSDEQKDAIRIYKIGSMATSTNSSGNRRPVNAWGEELSALDASVGLGSHMGSLLDDRGDRTTGKKRVSIPTSSRAPELENQTSEIMKKVAKLNGHQIALRRHDDEPRRSIMLVYLDEKIDSNPTGGRPLKDKAKLKRDRPAITVVTESQECAAMITKFLYDELHQNPNSMEHFPPNNAELSFLESVDDVMDRRMQNKQKRSKSDGPSGSGSDTGSAAHTTVVTTDMSGVGGPGGQAVV